VLYSILHFPKTPAFSFSSATLEEIHMRFGAVAVLATVLAIGTSFSAQAQPGGYAPPGSYQQSCTGISFNSSTQVLSAACFSDKREQGGFSCGSTLQVSACQPGTDIESIQCQLQCQAQTGTWGQGGAVPKGSYQQSCIGWLVTNGVLAAQCWNFSQGRINWGTTNKSAYTMAQLNLAQCGINGDIENIRGQLLCTQPATAGSGYAPINNHHPAPGTCKQGFVWRQANPEDHICVLLVSRQQAVNDNASAPQYTVKTNQVPAPCKQGYVWRNANAQDHVCVSPAVRTQTLEENQQAPSRTW
jgi:hypothetical protein